MLVLACYVLVDADSSAKAFPPWFGKGATQVREGGGRCPGPRSHTGPCARCLPEGSVAESGRYSIACSAQGIASSSAPWQSEAAPSQPDDGLEAFRREFQSWQVDDMRQQQKQEQSQTPEEPCQPDRPLQSLSTSQVCLGLFCQIIAEPGAGMMARICHSCSCWTKMCCAGALCYDRAHAC